MSARISLFLLVWGLAVVLAVVALHVHAARPGMADTSPATLPAAFIPENSSRSVVLLFVHEKCPCSRASVQELARHSKLHEAAEIRIFLSGPGSSVEGGWSIRELIESRLPQARIIPDTEGGYALQFGARTSGHAVLYRASGELHFSGGLTPSRGHMGPCSGRSAIETLVSGAALSGPTSTDAAAVFGCPLFSPGTETKACCGIDHPID
ncbi:MAG: hypothetical protein ACNA8P_01375 [Phycisphaerales bacterium]